jgi:glycosyltransferase involved in cell wall biosynthesis
VLGQRWTFFGFVSAERLRVLYGSCFAYLCTSSYEGFGLPILEAMSCGTPAVVASLSSLPEVGGAAALYAESQTPEAFACHLQALFGSQLRESMIRGGLVHAGLFTRERTFEHTIEFYRKVTTAFPRPPSR